MCPIDERQRRLVISLGDRNLLTTGLTFTGFGPLFVVLILTDGNVIADGCPVKLNDIWFPSSSA